MSIWNDKELTAKIIAEHEAENPPKELKTYRVMLVNKVYYGFDVEASGREEAMHKATTRMERGDWGREEYGEVDIFDVEEVK